MLLVVSLSLGVLEKLARLVGLSRGVDCPNAAVGDVERIRGVAEERMAISRPGALGRTGRLPTTCTIETTNCQKAFEELKPRGVKFETGVLDYPGGYIAVFVEHS